MSDPTERRTTNGGILIMRIFIIFLFLATNLYAGTLHTKGSSYKLGDFNKALKEKELREKQQRERELKKKQLWEKQRREQIINEIRSQNISKNISKKHKQKTNPLNNCRLYCELDYRLPSLVTLENRTYNDVRFSRIESIDNLLVATIVYSNGIAKISLDDLSSNVVARIPIVKPGWKIIEEQTALRKKEQEKIDKEMEIVRQKKLHK